MDSPPIAGNHPYAAFLDKVEKPARYSGGEVGSTVKDWSAVEATFCLAFPDVYDIGMSHLGFKILYKILNDDPRTLAERCYAPWVDLEGELRQRGLPLVSLETARPLSAFDVVGFSLQFELTYSNILTMLDLGGIALRSCDRGDSDPLVIAGGPTATHPEPLAPFLDAIVVGDGEEKATEIALTWVRLKKQGVPRRERLILLARLGGVYVPSLYCTRLDPDTGLTVVGGPVVDGLPFPIERALVDINQYPFPDSGPTGGPEAIFDRVSIEIARGCTEGCRFCQAGMIYRPVRERDPQQIVDTVARAVRHSGSDEVALTALSTADVSCISPLIKNVVHKLAGDRVSLGISSLRAYGLEPDLLDALRRERASGLTFAPEAGSQRMRDVVNKNVTEEQLLETAERVFSRGWGKMKLYFMIGLPTEQDEDVRGIVETGARTAQVGRKAAKKGVDVTVSVSTHVPKPHTPFQWAAMDTLAEVERKQQLLRHVARPHKAVKLRMHASIASVLEAIFARGDRPLADVLERAWRAGARFDSWEERLRLDLWEEAFSHFGIDRSKYLGTLPVTARLPWDHIDVGLEDGFLAKEYRKALQSRLSPPCGKVAGTFLHHTNIEDARADNRRLVCYDCGVACDMTQMRAERIDFLEGLGARRSLPVVGGDSQAPSGTDPQASLPNVAGPSGRRTPSERPNAIVVGTTNTGLEASPPNGVGPRSRPTPPERPHAIVVGTTNGTRVRFRFEKTGAMALLGHLDIVRELPRIFRRIGVRMVHTKGFHPKPDMTFAPALSLGVMSLDEYADIRLDGDIQAASLGGLVERMNTASPAGLVFRSALRLGDGDPSVTKVIGGARYVIAMARAALPEPAGDAEAWLAARCRAAMEAAALPIRRTIDGIGKVVDVRSYLLWAHAGDADAFDALQRAGLAGDLVAFDAGVAIRSTGAVKSSELCAVIAGDGQAPPPHRAVRVELFGLPDGFTSPAERFSPLDPRGRRTKAPAGTLEAIPA